MIWMVSHVISHDVVEADTPKMTVLEGSEHPMIRMTRRQYGTMSPYNPKARQAVFLGVPVTILW